jgi:hypothetical protein
MCRDGVRERDHAAKVRLPDVADIKLDDERISNGFDVDRNRTTIVRCGRSGSDLCVRAALILRQRQTKTTITGCDAFPRIDLRKSVLRLSPQANEGLINHYSILRFDLVLLQSKI